MRVTIKSQANETRVGLSGVIQGTYENLKMTCTCTKNNDPVAAAAGLCFSASDTVEVWGQKRHAVTAMKDLNVGDVIKTAKDKYQKVYSFGHRHETKLGQFLQLFVNNGKPPLELSPKHLVFVRDADGDPRPARADTVEVGDELVEEDSGQSLFVTKIELVTKNGLYMPLVPDSTIVVNGIWASTYVSIAEEAPSIVKTSAFFGLSEYQLLHWWLAPYRMLCMGISSRFGATTKPDSIDTNKYLQHQDEVFGFLVLMESLFGPTLAPCALLVTGTAVVWCLWSRNHKRMNVSNGEALLKL